MKAYFWIDSEYFICGLGCCNAIVFNLVRKANSLAWNHRLPFERNCSDCCLSLSRLSRQTPLYFNCCTRLPFNWSLCPTLPCGGQSLLLNIQERFLHEHNYNTFVDKLPALQTMEDFLYQTLKMGFLLLTLSLISGYFYISDFFTQKLTFKTILSVMAWIGFAGILFVHMVFGIRGKLIVLLTQVAFAVLVLSYFGNKFFFEVLAV